MLLTLINTLILIAILIHHIETRVVFLSFMQQLAPNIAIDISLAFGLMADNDHA